MPGQRLTCPSCASSLSASQPLPAGKPIKCPKCGKVFAVPAQAPPALSAEAKKTRLILSSKKPNGQVLVSATACPACKLHLKLPQPLPAGQKVKCPRCRAVFALVQSPQPPAKPTKLAAPEPKKTRLMGDAAKLTHLTPAPRGPTRLVCPGCKAVLNAKQPLPIGKEVRCPKCARMFRVPAKPELPPVDPEAKKTKLLPPTEPRKTKLLLPPEVKKTQLLPKQPQPPKPPAKRPAAKKDKRPVTRLRCPSCRTTLKLSGRLSPGSRVKCPRCSKMLLYGKPGDTLILKKPIAGFPLSPPASPPPPPKKPAAAAPPSPKPPGTPPRPDAKKPNASPAPSTPPKPEVKKPAPPPPAKADGKRTIVGAASPAPVQSQGKRTLTGDLPPLSPKSVPPPAPKTEATRPTSIDPPARSTRADKADGPGHAESAPPRASSKYLLLWLLLVLFALAALALADYLYFGFVFERRIPETAWQRFAPPNGRCYLEMPGVPNVSRGGSGQGAWNKFIVQRQKEDAAFLLTYADVAPASGSFSDVYKTIDRGLSDTTGKPGTLLSEKDLPLDGHAGKEYRIKPAARGVIIVRAFLVRGQEQDRIYVLLAGGSRLSRGDADRFFDSFHIEPAGGG